MQTLHTVNPESKEDKQNRIAASKAAKAHRSEKLGRTRRGELKSDIELANIFSHLGIDFFSERREEAFSKVVPLWADRKVEDLPKVVIDFLVDNFGLVTAWKNYKLVATFPNPEGGVGMHLLDKVAGSLGVHKREVEKFYDHFQNVLHGCLKREREAHLPGIGRLYVKSIPAKPKRKGTDPSTGKRIWLEPKPAGNKVRISFSKRLKSYVGELPVVLK